MASMNITIIQGNLGRDPEVRATPTGKQVANFSLAVSKRWEQQGEWKEATTWIRCVAWGKFADAVMAAHKGDSVLVQGEIQSRKYTAKDGSEKELTEVNVTQNLIVMPRNQDAAGGGYRSAAPAPARTAPARAPQRPDDEIPF